MDSIISLVIKNEGGYNNLYFADGTHTRCGITWEHNQEFYHSCGVYRPEDIRLITDFDIDRFYMSHYAKSGAIGMGFWPGYQYFDHYINAGPKAAVKILQHSLNMCSLGGFLVIDGILGPKTLKRLSEHTKDPDLLPWLITAREHDYIEKFFYKVDTDGPEYAARCLRSWIGRVKVGG